MSHQDRTVLVNMDQRRCLVDRSRCDFASWTTSAASSADLVHEAFAEPDPVFDGDDGHAPLLPAVLLVEALQGCAAVLVIRSALALVPTALRILRVEPEPGEGD